MRALPWIYAGSQAISEVTVSSMLFMGNIDIDFTYETSRSLFTANKNNHEHKLDDEHLDL